jgi:ParB family chromosome partitioning protein
MTDSYTTISLSKLTRAKTNVRRTGGGDSLAELMASIESHGLLQGLTVRKRTTGNDKAADKYEVVAGARRLAALKELARNKRIPRNFEVPCRVLDGEDSLEVSLAENVVRVPLHPADQLDAFKKLHEKGLPAEDIAARFGVSTAVVLQRLKLASVSPDLIEVYRDGGMTLEQLTAFAISDDHTAQERVWSGGSADGLDPRSIRHALTSDLVSTSDRRVYFVGREVYEAAGGRLVRDLFSADDEAYLEDSELLERLVAEKLQAEADTLKAEGWSWVQPMTEMDYARYGRMGRVSPAEVPLSEEKEAELRALSERLDALVEEHGEDPADDIEEEYEQLSQAMQAIGELQKEWAPEEMAKTGALVILDYAGDLQVVRGLVRPEDLREQLSTAESADDAELEEKPQARPAHSESLFEELSAHRTAALRALLVAQPDVALTALTYAMVLGAFFGAERQSCLEVNPTVTDLTPFSAAIAASPATEALKRRWEQWISRVPPVDGLWDWLIGQDTETRLELLALCTAATVNAVQKRHDAGNADALDHADALAAGLSLDMADWWEPTRESYFDHVAKAQVLAAVTEGVSAQAAENIARMKKPAMAARAEDLLAGKRWLPGPLRGRAPSTVSEV